MTVLLTPTTLTVCGRASPPTVKAFQLQKTPSSADADGQRLSGDVARGDDNSYQELYYLYHERLFRLSLALGRGDESLAHETVQSVFLTAAAKLRRVESEEHLWNWLARVARQ